MIAWQPIFDACDIVSLLLRHRSRRHSSYFYGRCAVLVVASFVSIASASMRKLFLSAAPPLPKKSAIFRGPRIKTKRSLPSLGRSWRYFYGNRAGIQLSDGWKRKKAVTQTALNKTGEPCILSHGLCWTYVTAFLNRNQWRPQRTCGGQNDPGRAAIISSQRHSSLKKGFRLIFNCRRRDSDTGILPSTYTYRDGTGFWRYYFETFLFSLKENKRFLWLIGNIWMQ